MVYGRFLTVSGLELFIEEFKKVFRESWFQIESSY